MLYEYQVLYRLGTGPILTVGVIAETPNEARALVQPHEAGRAKLPEHVVVTGVGPGVPFVDWSKPNFRKDEAAAYLSFSESQIEALMQRGQLPRPRDGYPVFPRAILDEVVRKRMRLDEWERDQQREARAA